MVSFPCLYGNHSIDIRKYLKGAFGTPAAGLFSEGHDASWSQSMDAKRVSAGVDLRRS